MTIIKMTLGRGGYHHDHDDTQSNWVKLARASFPSTQRANMPIRPHHNEDGVMSIRTYVLGTHSENGKRIVGGWMLVKLEE